MAPELNPESPAPAPRRRREAVLKIAGLLAALVVLFVLSRVLPVASWLDSFNSWVGDLGILGFIIFIVAYIATTVLLLPGAILTVGAGFVFGIGWGFAAVSIGSTLGASLAFLIGRFFAREKIEAATRDKPRFRKIDNAIGKKGAKLIFLLRLSPVIPFNLSNYFYGLTAVGFWPYVLASWIGMMPGTLLYVYLGSLGRAGVETAAGAPQGRTTAEWVFLALGLLATIVVTVWVSKLARNAIRDA